ncbi:MAG: hypothetical protein ACI9WS_000932 [Paraglaciecola psychrophila]|jgi:hypothetical protein
MNTMKMVVMGLLLVLLPASLMANEGRTEAISPTDRLYFKNQIAAIDDLAGRHFGRQLNGQKGNDFAVMQRLLDDKIVGPEDVRSLQAMGVVLGTLLQSQYSLKWVIYVDRLGRSRSLQLLGFDRDVIFPTTQISRRAQVGLQVNVASVYAELEQSIIDIRKNPPF